MSLPKLHCAPLKYGQIFMVSEVEPMLNCLKLDQYGIAPLVSKEVPLYVILWENDPTSHLIYHLCEQFPNEFVAWIGSTLFILSLSHLE